MRNIQKVTYGVNKTSNEKRKLLHIKNTYISYFSA
jgi:hypothetical protein